MNGNENENGSVLVVFAIILAVLVLFAIVFSQGQNGSSGLYQLWNALGLHL